MDDSGPMNYRNLRLIARFLPLPVLNSYINAREHNPEYYSIRGALEVKVDSLLGFDHPPVFESSDDLFAAILKNSRNKIIEDNWRAAVDSALGSKSYTVTNSLMEQHLDETIIRVAQRLGFTELSGNYNSSVLRIFLLLSYYSRMRVRNEITRLRHEFTGLKHAWARQIEFWKDFVERMPVSIARNSPKPVVFITSLGSPHVGYALGKVVSKLHEYCVPVCVLFVDGFDLRISMSIKHGWEWLEGVELISLPAIPNPPYEALIGTLVPQLPQRYRVNKLSGFPSIPGLNVNFRKKTREFVFAANCASFILESIAPRSVLNMADGSTYGHAFSYCCVSGGTPVYSYVPMIRYPMRPDALLTPSHLVASRLDIPEDHEKQPRRIYTVVGTPLLNPLLSAETNDVIRNKDRLDLLYFSKRDFPNQNVIARLKQILDQLSKKFHVVIKPHPNDFFDYSQLISILDSSEFTLVQSDKVEVVDELVRSSDIVISGPSNVLWSAFLQCKPVVFINFSEAGADHYAQAYGRYAPAPFVTACEMSELTNTFRYLLNLMDEYGQLPVDDEKYQALIRDVFNDGKTDPAQRVATLLSQIGMVP